MASKLIGREALLSEHCCGEAWTLGATRPDIANQLRFRKQEDLADGIRTLTGEEDGAGDVKLLTSCPACQSEPGFRYARRIACQCDSLPGGIQEKRRRALEHSASLHPGYSLGSRHPPQAGRAGKRRGRRRIGPGGCSGRLARNWESETTARNLRLIREARERRGEAMAGAEEIEQALMEQTR